MLIGALVAGLVLGLLAGGSLNNLAAVRLRVVQVLFLGLLLFKPSGLLGKSRV